MNSIKQDSGKPHRTLVPIAITHKYGRKGKGAYYLKEVGLILKMLVETILPQ